jgi:nitrous oxide reductase accessory protein NosL
MTKMIPRPLGIVAALLVVVGLPLCGKWLRHHEAPRCEVDGLRIDPVYRVRIVDGAGNSHWCCGVDCARLWLKRNTDSSAEVYVTDETTGTEIDARSAFFVESAVVTNPVTLNRVHAFRRRADAEEHARSFGGEVLTKSILHPSRERQGAAQATAP